MSVFNRRSSTDTGYNAANDPASPQSGPQVEPNRSTLGPFDPSRIQQNQGENWGDAVTRYKNDYHAPDRDQVLNGIDAYTPPTAQSGPDYTNPQGQLSAVTGWLHTGGFGGDDPNYWVGRINQTGGFTPENLSYWQKRIAAGPQGGQPGGAYYDPGALGINTSASSQASGMTGQNPLPPDSSNNLFQTLLQRSQQSLNVSPDDPIIKGQSNAYDAEQTRAMRQYLSAQAEKGGGSYGDQAAETRSAAEGVGRNDASFTASLMGNELTQRRNEIQSALTEMGGMLSDDQKLKLQGELSQLDNALKQQQINSGNDQFAAQFGLSAAEQAWLHHMYESGQFHQS